MAQIEDFLALDIRAGTIIECSPNDKARKPAYKLRIDFGPALGEKHSSAQLCNNYPAETLVGRQILAVTNLPPRQVAGVKSEVLVLAVVSDREGTVLIGPNQPVLNGDKLA